MYTCNLSFYYLSIHCICVIVWQIIPVFDIDKYLKQNSIDSSDQSWFKTSQYCMLKHITVVPTFEIKDTTIDIQNCLKIAVILS
jgi:hypothetical protein